MALIKSETLVKRLNKLIAGVDEESDALISVRDVLRLISVIQTVDAVEVVRCKDCKHATLTYQGECKYCDFWQEEGGDSLYLDGDFFCAAGERRDEE